MLETRTTKTARNCLVSLMTTCFLNIFCIPKYGVFDTFHPQVCYVDVRFSTLELPESDRNLVYAMVCIPQRPIPNKKTGSMMVTPRTEPDLHQVTRALVVPT